MSIPSVIPAAILAVLLGSPAVADEAPEAKPEAAKVEESSRSAADEGRKDAAPAECRVITGSRIRPGKHSNCTPNRPFRSYSKENLDMTGEIDLVEALRQLDPAFH